MEKNSKLFIFLLLTFVCCNKLVAQKITISIPEKVYVGENFRLSYTINSQDVENFHAGTVPSGIEIIAGPYTSQQSSYQMVNGHTSSIHYMQSNKAFIVCLLHRLSLMDVR